MVVVVWEREKRLTCGFVFVFSFFLFPRLSFSPAENAFGPCWISKVVKNARTVYDEPIEEAEEEEEEAATTAGKGKKRARRHNISPKVRKSRNVLIQLQEEEEEVQPAEEDRAQIERLHQSRANLRRAGGADPLQEALANASGAKLKGATEDAQEEEEHEEEEEEEEEEEHEKPQPEHTEASDAALGREFQILGPLWVGPMHDAEYLARMAEEASRREWEDTFALLETMKAEAEAEAGGALMYYHLGEVQRLLSARGLALPPLTDLIALLRAAGHTASHSHIERKAIKTSARLEELVAVVKGRVVS